jgi:hypothetical protein
MIFAEIISRQMILEEPGSNDKSVSKGKSASLFLQNLPNRTFEYKGKTNAYFNVNARLTTLYKKDESSSGCIFCTQQFSLRYFMRKW